MNIIKISKDNALPSYLNSLGGPDDVFAAVESFLRDIIKKDSEFLEIMSDYSNRTLLLIEALSAVKKEGVKLTEEEYTEQFETILYNFTLLLLFLQNRDIIKINNINERLGKELYIEFKKSSTKKKPAKKKK